MLSIGSVRDTNSRSLTAEWFVLIPQTTNKHRSRRVACRVKNERNKKPNLGGGGGIHTLDFRTRFLFIGGRRFLYPRQTRARKKICMKTKV